MNKYVLEGHNAVQEPDLMKWAIWFETANRTVKKNTIGKSLVSTIFLGLDHGFDNNRPLLFETMVFDGPLDQECERCSTWEEAEEMHAEMCARVLKA
jgi:hypothetical protein